MQVYLKAQCSLHSCFRLTWIVYMMNFLANSSSMLMTLFYVVHAARRCPIAGGHMTMIWRTWTNPEAHTVCTVQFFIWSVNKHWSTTFNDQWRTTSFCWTFSIYWRNDHQKPDLVLACWESFHKRPRFIFLHQAVAIVLHHTTIKLLLNALWLCLYGQWCFAFPQLYSVDYWRRTSLSYVERSNQSRTSVDWSMICFWIVSSQYVCNQFDHLHYVWISGLCLVYSLSEQLYRTIRTSHIITPY